MFPRADGILLGGTFERDVFDPTPDPATIARIVDSAPPLVRRLPLHRLNSLVAPTHLE